MAECGASWVFSETKGTGQSRSKGNCLMRIWVDADASPVEIKELLYRTAERLKIKVTLVANQSMRVPPSEFIDVLLVPDGANVADRKIVELAVPGDLVVTA